MAGRQDDDWFRRPGRLLDEGGERLFTGKYVRMTPADYAKPSYQSSRPLSASGKTTIHFRHEIVHRPQTRRYTLPPNPSSRGGWGPVFPPRALSGTAHAGALERLRREAPGAELGKALPQQTKALGARYNRPQRHWEAPQSAIEEGRIPSTWLDDRAKKNWLRLRNGSGRGKAGAGAAHQAYIERHSSGEEERRREIESDDLGPISFGSIAPKAKARIEFWHTLEARERPGARLQFRIIAELPYWVTPADRRSIAEAFCQVFSSRGLPFHAVVHKPNVENGGDRRNFHIHIVYAARRVESSGDWTFSKKNRDVQDRNWIRDLRRHFVEAANVIIRRRRERGAAPPRGRGEYDARSNRAIGIRKQPGTHLGPRRTYLERAGVPTVHGVENANRERAWRELMRSAPSAEAARAGLSATSTERLLRQERNRCRAARRHDWARNEIGRIYRKSNVSVSNHSTWVGTGKARRILRRSRLLEIEAEAARRLPQLTVLPGEVLPKPWSADDLVTRRISAPPAASKPAPAVATTTKTKPASRPSILRRALQMLRLKSPAVTHVAPKDRNASDQEPSAPVAPPASKTIVEAAASAPRRSVVIAPPSPAPISPPQPPRLRSTPQLTPTQTVLTTRQVSMREGERATSEPARVPASAPALEGRIQAQTKRLPAPRPVAPAPSRMGAASQSPEHSLSPRPPQALAARPRPPTEASGVSPARAVPQQQRAPEAATWPAAAPRPSSTVARPSHVSITPATKAAPGGGGQSTPVERGGAPGTPPSGPAIASSPIPERRAEPAVPIKPVLPRPPLKQRRRDRDLGR
jgi:MobA/MobL family